MELYIFPSKTEMAVAAAERAASTLTEAILARGEANLILATGASQFEMLSHLITLDVDWSKVTAFHLDEYIGLPASHPASFRKYLQERFVDQLPTLRKFHFVDGEAPDPQVECRRLGELIGSLHVDLACIGIGENGHLAFNDPPADFDTHDSYIIVDLDEACRRQQVGEGWFPDLQAVPRQAISMSIRQIMRSQAIVCTVPDARKAEAVKKTVEGQVSNLVPASILQIHPTCWLFLDKPSASLLSQPSNGVELGIPGFVDLQVNGFLGVDFSSPDLTEEAFVSACQSLLQRGTAAFLPTLITSPLDVYERNLPLMAKALQRPEFRGRLLGLHLEGPFISAQPGAVGAHNPAWVRPPDLDLLKQLFEWAGGTVRMLTLAAELEGADTLARWATEHGALISVGHTLAAPADLDRLSQAGAKVLTHLGNGLPKMLPKFDNPIWAGLADDRYTAMFIADGHHLPAGALRAMLRAKSVNRTIIVSDAAPVAGLPPGRYITLSNAVLLEPSGRLHNPEKGYLVGSSATLLQCMNHLASQGFLSLEELLSLGFYNPLRLLGIAPERLPHPDRKLYFDEAGRKFILAAPSPVSA